MIQMQEDAVLMEQLKAGSKTAYIDLYNRYKYNVHAISFYTLKNQTEAEDVVQEVFMELWKNRFELKIKSSLRNYLITAAKNKSLNILKTKSHHTKYIISKSLEGIKESPDTRLENDDIMKDINTALDNVNSKIIREAFNLVYVKDLKYEEAAQQLGVSVPTSRNYVAKAIKQLRLFLKDSK